MRVVVAVAAVTNVNVREAAAAPPPSGTAMMLIDADGSIAMYLRNI